VVVGRRCDREALVGALVHGHRTAGLIEPLAPAVAVIVKVLMANDAAMVGWPSRS